MRMQSDYSYDNGAFIIQNYNKSKTFSSFLPGIAGKKGIPLWAFYVNRAQGISGFGLQDKNHPIMVFHSANKAYETVSTIGFRTFIKSEGKIYEPFAIDSNFQNEMRIESNMFSITEHNSNLELETKVTYFGLPNEKLAALVRIVEIKNGGPKPRKLEIIDGLAELLPAGIRNDEFKAMSNLLSSWMDVECLSSQFAFYRLRGSTGDSAEVGEVHEGNFYVAFDDKGLISPIADPVLIFGSDTSKRHPLGLEAASISELSAQKQVTVNQVGCGFTPYEKQLDGYQTLRFVEIIGHTHSLEVLKNLLPQITSMEYITKKKLESYQVIDALLQDVKTKTNIPEFDAYIQQSYLDNLLRGGYPLNIGSEIYHLYARRHGDLERDYNFFSLAPEYYSTGSGNFRDVCQNRRLDSFIHPEVGAFNIVQFASLIQMDGYNPLAVNGISYQLGQDKIPRLLEKHFSVNRDFLIPFFNNRFRIGELVNFVERNQIQVKTEETDYLTEIVESSQPVIEAAFGEGYWVDHFTYLFDLIESYLAIYPDLLNQLLFEEEKYLYFDSPTRILKQTEKTVLVQSDKIRQYGSLEHRDRRKIETLHMNPDGTNYLKQGGQLYKSNLYVKLLVLALNKFALLDPYGMGVEMEADKPGWNDAMNGLPGLFGSGVSEMIELKRILDFMKLQNGSNTVSIPLEVYRFFMNIASDFSYFQRVKAREAFRDDIRFGLSQENQELAVNEIQQKIQLMDDYLNDNLDKLFTEFDGLIPTYLTYKVTQYVPIIKDGQPEVGYKGLPLAQPLAFERDLALVFLEAPARLLKVDFPLSKKRYLAQKVLQSDLFDPRLRQYKTSGPLENAPAEIGRVRAFTKGWLERESNFLHMTYKYVSGLLKANLYSEFHQAMQDNFVCFMDPSVYGRSTLENSSFIAPTNNPNPRIHGQGFFARLSGSTVEVLDMWLTMMTGVNPFTMKAGNLAFALKPTLGAEFFNAEGRLSFSFRKKMEITYIKASRKTEFEKMDVAKYELIDDRNVTTTVLGTEVLGDLAYEIRNNRFTKIKIYLK